MYASLLYLTWGAFFQNPSLLGFCLAVMATIFLILTAKADENECLQYFGFEYRAYMRQTKMFIPFLI